MRAGEYLLVSPHLEKRLALLLQVVYGEGRPSVAHYLGVGRKSVVLEDGPTKKKKYAQNKQYPGTTAYMDASTTLVSAFNPVV